MWKAREHPTQGGTEHPRGQRASGSALGPNDPENSIRSRPASFARYIAASASRITSSGRAFPSEQLATPRLAVVITCSPAIVKGSFSCPAKRSAKSRASPGFETSPTKITTNSSPPYRATVSVGRTAAERRSATWIKSSSPALATEPMLCPAAVPVPRSQFGELVEDLFIVRIHQIREGRPAELALVVPAQPFDGRVRFGDPAIEGQGEDADRGGVEEGPELELAGGHRLFGPLALRDVDHDPLPVER